MGKCVSFVLMCPVERLYLSVNVCMCSYGFLTCVLGSCYPVYTGHFKTVRCINWLRNSTINHEPMQYRSVAVKGYSYELFDGDRTA